MTVSACAVVGSLCCSSLVAQSEDPPLAVFAARPDAGAVRLSGFSGGEAIAVPPELAAASWLPFGMRGHSTHRSGGPDAVVEVGGELPRIQVRSDYQIIGFESAGARAGDGGRRGTRDRFAGVAAVGHGGARILLGGEGERFRPVRNGACVSPDGQLVGILVGGANDGELFVLNLEPRLPSVRAVNVPERVDELKPESLTVIDDALFVVGRVGRDGWALLRATFEGQRRISAGIVAGPFPVLKPHLAYSPAGVAFLAGEDDLSLDVYVARPAGAPFNLTLYPEPYLEHRPDSARLAISDDASAVAYSIEEEEYPEAETFCHATAVPGEGGRIHVTSDEHFTVYVEQEVIIFFRGGFGLVFTAGHRYEMDFYLFSEFSGAGVRNLTGTAGDTIPYPPGTLTPQSAVATGSGLLVLSADGFEGRAGVVAVGAGSEPVFREIGIGAARSFFDVGPDTYFVAASDGGSSAPGIGLYRIRAGELAPVASASAAANARLLLHDTERALFYLEGAGILELRAGSAPAVLVPGDVEPAVALSPCGEYLVYSRAGGYFALRLTDGITTRLDGVVGAGQVLAAGETFLRGDVGGDRRVSTADAFALLGALFGGHPVECPDAADANDDGQVTIFDFLILLKQLHHPRPILPPPFPDPGVDPTLDELSCCS